MINKFFIHANEHMWIDGWNFFSGYWMAMQHVVELSEQVGSGEPSWTDWLAGIGAAIGAVATSVAAFFAWRAASQSATITMEGSRESIVRDALTTQINARNTAASLQDKADSLGSLLLALPGSDPLRSLKLKSFSIALSKQADRSGEIKKVALEAKTLQNVSSARQQLTEVQAKVREIEMEVQRFETIRLTGWPTLKL